MNHTRHNASTESRHLQDVGHQQRAHDLVPALREVINQSRSLAAESRQVQSDIRDAKGAVETWPPRRH